MSDKKAPADLSKLVAFKGRRPVKIHDEDGLLIFEGRLQSMSGEDRESFYADSMAASNAGEGQTFPKGLQARTICRCLIDTAGTPATFALVQALDAQIIDALFEAAMAVSGLDKAPADADADAKKS